MKNPIVLIVGAAVMAVAAVAVLAGVTVERWDDPAAPAQSTTADADFATDKAREIEQPAEKTQPDEDLTAAVVKAPVEDPAVASEPVAAAPAAVTVAEKIAPAEKIEPAEGSAGAPEAASAAPDPASEGPSFDVVRMEDDGSLLAVGRAAPGSEVALILDGEVIATVPADDAGEWLIMPDRPLPPGSHELTVETSDAAGAGTNPGQVVMLDVPERDGLGTKAEPDTGEEDTAGQRAEPEEEPASPEAVAGAREPRSDADEELVALAPLPEKDENEVSGPETPSDPLDAPLTLESVDYDENGGIVFSGRAQPGLTVGVYVDNRFAGETTVGLDGRWEFTGSGSIAPGRHTLRADLKDPTGKLSARIILPFVRADSRDVAAFVESRRDTAEPRGASEPAEDESAPEVPVAAQDATQQSGPDAATSAEPASPQPETQPPLIAETLVTKPETVVAQLPAPEPEQPTETAMVEPVDPEPEPPAPVVAELPAQEPAPEAPPAAEAPAFEPETSNPDGEATRVDAAPEVAAAEQASRSAPQLQVAPPGPGHVVIQPGNNLWRISRVIYGRGIEYTVIYQANRDRIRDPDLIYPGQIFATPGVRPPEAIDPDWREPLSPDDLARQNTAE